MPNARRYIPGFLPRSLAFAVPSGIIVALTLTGFALVARSLGVGEDQLRTGSTIILAVVGIWILSILSRPLNRFKVIVIGVMFIALITLFTVPLSIEFFQLVDPGREGAYALTAFTIGAIGAIEIVRLFHVRFVRASLARAQGAKGSGAGSRERK
jgi:cation-transporting ATPase E